MIDTSNKMLVGKQGSAIVVMNAFGANKVNSR